MTIETEDRAETWLEMCEAEAVRYYDGCFTVLRNDEGWVASFGTPDSDGEWGPHEQAPSHIWLLRPFPTVEDACHSLMERQGTGYGGRLHADPITKPMFARLVIEKSPDAGMVGASEVFEL